MPQNKRSGLTSSCQNAPYTLIKTRGMTELHLQLVVPQKTQNGVLQAQQHA
jgi:hypothetical protein